MKAKSIYLSDNEIDQINHGYLSKMNPSSIRCEIKQVINIVEFAMDNLDYIDHRHAFEIINSLYDAQQEVLDLFYNAWDIKHSNEKYYNNRYREIRKRVISYYGAKCQKCGSTKDIQLDHIKPASKYPQLFLQARNMQVLCASCNYEKSNKNMDDYRGDKKVLDGYMGEF